MIEQLINSKVFKTTWEKYYNINSKTYAFKAIKDFSFIKHKVLPIFKNLGKTLPQGVFYDFSLEDNAELKNKVLFIYNVPSYYKVKLSKNIEGSTLKHFRIKEYEGYLSDFEAYETKEAYLNDKLSNKSLSSITRKKKRLENCFNIKYKTYYGGIDKNVYDIIFKRFKELLKEKFDLKQEYYSILTKKNWDFYYELVYKMIFEKTASLEVIYSEDVPINIFLNYHFEKKCYYSIPVFDTNYSKYGVGSIGILKSIEECFSRGDTKFDLLKGEYGYKKKWANNLYHFEHHIYYDSSSIICKSIAFFIRHQYRLIQYLRKRGYNDLYHKFQFRIKVKSGNRLVPNKGIQFSEITSFENNHEIEGNAEKINFLKSEYWYLHKIVFEFVYTTQDHIDNIIVYQKKIHSNSYAIYGKEKKMKVNFSKKLQV